MVYYVENCLVNLMFCVVTGIRHRTVLQNTAGM